MATNLIVEDGTMPEGANTYASLQTIADYLTPRGAEKWFLLSESAQVCFVIQATDYLNGLPYKGAPVGSGRVMAWPQKGQLYADCSPVPENVVPVQVVNALCELCAYAADGRFTPRTTVDEKAGAVTSQNVNGVSMSFATPDTSAYTGLTGFSTVDALLDQFLRKGDSVTVVGLRRG